MPMSTTRKTTRNVTPKTPFVPVFHKNGHRIPGLWQRGARFYAQLRVHESGLSRSTRIALEAATVAKAVEELEEKKLQRRKGELVVLTHAPKLAEAIEQYKASAEYTAKRPASQSNETGYFKLWSERLGHLRVDKIQTAAIVGVRDEVHKRGCSARTCNLYVGALKQVLKYCRERGHLRRIPEVRRLKQPKAPRRPYLEDSQFKALIDACNPMVTKNSDLMRRFLQFLALTGAREQEAARVRWQDVDLQRGIVTIGADGLSKNHEARNFNINGELAELLAEMKAVHPPDSSYLFPSPQRGKHDLHIRNFRNSLNKVRTAAKLPHIAFHDMRHTFISKCIMASIPVMTIAEWVGHKDGGVLIGKVYGHLSKDHKADMASKLSLFKKPENVVELPQQAAG